MKKRKKHYESATFGAGCFWGVQSEFDKINGVIKTEVGFMGGDEKKFPSVSYEEVCFRDTKYAEVINI